jgi:hypothetical protein
MRSVTAPRKPFKTIDIEAVSGLIARTQRPDGEIPWSDEDKTDPWDMVEAAMGLAVGGRLSEAERAYLWLADRQLEDGSWYASYRFGVPEDRTRDTNMSSYIAVGLWHHYMISDDRAFLRELWPVAAAGLDFALSFQTPTGEIHWARSPEGVVDPMALLTGSSSVFMSLKCGLAAARELGLDQPHWRRGLDLLGDAILHRRHRFNLTKSRFSMDWFYPMLCGAVTEGDAKRRLEKYWEKFVIDGQGVLCVSDEPWVTIAETSEFALALTAIGQVELARIVFGWIQERCFDDGSYWCGYTFPDMIVWPEDKITWTNAAALLAADALLGLTPASALFHHDYWRRSPI